MSYFQLDKGILDSSLWVYGTAAEFKLWMYLLVRANPRTGVVMDPVWLISQRSGLPQATVEAALATFEAPDPKSRSKGDEGRRIRIDEDGNIQILNYLRFRDKDHSTERVRAWRDRKRGETVGNAVSPVSETVKRRKRRETPFGTKDKDKDKSSNYEIAVDPIAPPPAAPMQPISSWSQEACDDWIARFEGTAPGGPIGKALRPLVDKHGWEVVRPAWRAYLLGTEPEFANPARFASTFGNWRKYGPKPEPPREPLPPGDTEAYQFFEAMKVRLSGVLSRESMATWFRPTYGRAWVNRNGEEETLLITVPSEQFANQMRFYRDRLRAAASELGKPNLLFKTAVWAADPADLHDGSIR